MTDFLLPAAQSPITLRPFRDADASAVARLVTLSVQGHWTYTPEQFREQDDPARVRLVAEQGGEVMATAAFAPFSPAFPEALRLDFAGNPALYSAQYPLLLGRMPAGITRLLGVTREDWPPMHFFQAAGFRNAWQSWGAHLDLTAFDGTRFSAAEERLFLDGYEALRLDDAAPPADWAALHWLYEEGIREAPHNPTTTPDPLTLQGLRDTVRREEVAFVVRLRGRVVASTRLTPRGTEVESEHTVTDRLHRGRGLATVLKARALAWAREQGYLRAGTGGTVLNLPMLRVNARLGYLPEAMWVTWERRLPTD